MSELTTTSTLLERLEHIQQRVAHASGGAKVCLIAVSKTHPVASLQTLYDAGIRDFGESYIQEWLQKKSQLPEDIRWHLIGRMQSNKAKYIQGAAHMIHAVDRQSLARAINSKTQGTQDVLIQVNIAREESKAGVLEAELPAMVEYINACEHLRLRGLMAIPPYVDNPQDNAPHFEAMASLMAQTHELLEDASVFDVLSMGMSGDFDVAIAKGATHVRVGTALFGPRPSP